jgi:hypothetical protein
MYFKPSLRSAKYEGFSRLAARESVGTAIVANSKSPIAAVTKSINKIAAKDIVE